MSGPAIVYRLYDADDNLLYVGQAMNFFRFKHRLWSHRRKTWGSEIARHELVEYQVEAEAADAEKVAIILEKPHYNIQTRGHLKSSARTEDIKIQVSLPPDAHTTLKLEAINREIGLGRLVRQLLIEATEGLSR